MHLHKPETRMIDVEKINVASEYQRDMIVPHINEMERNFDSDAVGFLLVGQRSDGSYWAVDGLQRLSMARKMGISKVPCEVVQSSGPAFEAALFRKRARRRNLSACQLFKALVAEGNAEACEILSVINGVGLNVSGMAESRKGGSIGCVNACRDAFRRDGADHLRLVLTVLKKAWGGGHENAYHQAMVGGLSLFLHRYQGDVDVKRLTSKMASESPSHVLGQAKPFKLMHGGSRDKAVGNAFKAYYDTGLRKKLPVWSDSEPQEAELEEAVA
jgi:hypothetical protein